MGSDLFAAAILQFLAIWLLFVMAFGIVVLMVTSSHNNTSLAGRDAACYAVCAGLQWSRPVGRKGEMEMKDFFYTVCEDNYGQPKILEAGRIPEEELFNWYEGRTPVPWTEVQIGEQDEAIWLHIGYTNLSEQIKLLKRGIKDTDPVKKDDVLLFAEDGDVFIIAWPADDGPIDEELAIQKASRFCR